MSGDLRQYRPTTRRLGRLYQAGIFPHSRVLTAALVLGAALITIAGLAPLLMAVLQAPFAELLAAGIVRPEAALTGAAIVSTGLLMVGLLSTIWLVTVTVGALQRGASPGDQTPGQLPLSEREVSFHRWPIADLMWELLMSGAILGGGAIIIYNRLPALMHMSVVQPTAMARNVQQVIWAFGWQFGLLMVGLGLCDYLYQRAVFSQGAAMTRRELEQERRETEGHWLLRWWRQRRVKIRR